MHNRQTTSGSLGVLFLSTAAAQDLASQTVRMCAAERCERSRSHAINLWNSSFILSSVFSSHPYST